PCQCGLQRGPGGVDPTMEPVQPGGPPGQVETAEHDDQRHCCHDDEHGCLPAQRGPPRNIRRSVGRTAAYTRATSAATVFQSEMCTARLAALDRSARRSGASRSAAACSAKWYASPTRNRAPARPASSTAEKAGMSLATMAAPAAIASVRTIPKLSPPRLGAQNTSAEW